MQMKFFIALFLASTLPAGSLAYDAKSCQSYANERNKTLPKNVDGAVLTKVSCSAPVGRIPGSLVMHLTVSGVDKGTATDEQKIAFANYRKTLLKPALCKGLQSEYGFADSIEGYYCDQKGNFIVNVFIDRKDCL